MVDLDDDLTYGADYLFALERSVDIPSLDSLLQQELIRREMELARQLQASFLPEALPQIYGYDFFALHHVADKVGNDFYHFLPLPDGKCAAFLGSVIGKSLAGALVRAKLAAEARLCFLTEEDPAVAMARVSDAVCEDAGTLDCFISLAAAVLDPRSHTIKLVNAGDATPLWYRRGGNHMEECMSHTAADMPLDIMPGQQFSTCRLEPGDAVILVGPGSSSPPNMIACILMYSKLSSALTTGRLCEFKGLREDLMRYLRCHPAERVRNDDVTLVCFARQG